MIILNTIRHDNNKIEYHFTHENYKGVAFKILAAFNAVEEDGEHFLTCEYDQLEHVANGLVVSEEEVKAVCDEFGTYALQSLLVAIQSEVENTAGGDNVSQ